MNNSSAARALCASICNTYFPDIAVVDFALFQRGIDPHGEAAAKDPEIFRVAVALVMGYVESSRSEAGISVGVNSDALKESLKYWCLQYGLEPDEELGYIREIDNGSNLW